MGCKSSRQEQHQDNQQAKIKYMFHHSGMILVNKLPRMGLKLKLNFKVLEKGNPVTE